MPKKDELKEYLYSEGYRMMRDVPDNGICGIMKMIFTTGLFVDLEQWGYSHRFCYHTTEEAIRSLKEWTGENEPKGFIVRK